MNAIREIELESTIIGPEPMGCVHCREGAKMVLLVTGLCACGCYYCPLSEKKTAKDHVYANELCVGEGKDLDSATHSGDQVELPSGVEATIIEEARSISAVGTGITGGDPLLVLQRTIRLIELLKDSFGKDHHIHLYTASLPSPAQLEMLKEAGLDELRFHLVDLLEMYTPGDDLPVEVPETSEGHGSSDLDEFLQGYLDAVRASLDIGLNTGVEIPMIPGHGALIRWVIPKLEDAGNMFLNLNELEFSPTNASELVKRGFEVRDELSSAVKGSREEGIAILEWTQTRQQAGRNPVPMTIHFCSSRYKDAGQLRRRLHRRAENTALPHEHITDDDTLLLGIVESTWDSREFARELVEKYEIPEELVYVNPGPGPRKDRVEIAPWVLQEIAEEIKAPAYIIEEYPTSDRLEVEREKLN